VVGISALDMAKQRTCEGLAGREKVMVERLNVENGVTPASSEFESNFLSSDQTKTRDLDGSLLVSG